MTHTNSVEIATIAKQYGLSEAAVQQLAEALQHGGGKMAQFNHPDLGGMGQWSQGGMIMIGDMFNQDLKQRINGALNALAHSQAANATTAKQTTPPAAQTNAMAWWPAELGQPSSTGAQNDSRYAIFPAQHRLVVQVNGKTTVYDTLDHVIYGVSQQQGSSHTMSFTSQHGTVNLHDLPEVGAESELPATSPARAADVSTQPTDVFATLERLAELKQKGILTEEEFAQKKADLLGRL